ncbi:hypothetical protein CLV92_102129 [Kineococcus xinjiangensis]|uniref:Tetratricopeptide repeat protein n=1 Tax=Kineococcus xinjiangensis TaxID=512762 RepID=A0A2S6IUU3_9ACTN|nr:hypothetical protein CLV92_102129 [Kineococcus xinjiangensis]
MTAALDARGQQAVADLLETWAYTPQPGDTVSIGRLLIAASEHRVYAGDPHGALRLAQRAVETGDDVPPDARCYVVSALLACGRGEEAWVLTERVMADHVRADAEVYLFLGETYGWYGEAAAAAQVFGRGLFRCAGDSEAVESLLGAWRRSRAARSGRIDLDDLPGQRVPH